MIHSMTAFARVESHGQEGSLVCEIRSINHRYQEISLYLPELLRVLEMPLRESIRKHIKRGKIECVIRYQSTPEAKIALCTVNESLAKALCRAGEKIASYLREPAPINPGDILRLPGVLQTNESELTEIQEAVFALLEKGLTELVAARHREGEELKQLFLTRMQSLQQELAKVSSRLPAVLIEQRERLQKRFQEAKLELDPSRLEQEMLILAQKTDVAEEIDRTTTHIAEFRRVLQQGGMIGRRLDFLLQELNREANTLGSKSADPIITHAAVEMKVLIEQIREQVQNIE